MVYEIAFNAFINFVLVFVGVSIVYGLDNFFDGDQKKVGIAILLLILVLALTLALIILLN